MKSAEIIKMLREAKGMSQSELAAKVGYKTRSSITKIESGVSDPSQSALYRIAKALDVKPSTLIPDAAESESQERNILLSLAEQVPESKTHLAIQILQSILEDAHK